MAAMLDTIVMYPSIGISHILPMVELAKQIQAHHPDSFSTTILVTPQPFADGVATTEAAIANIAATVPSITFHHLSSSQSLPAPPPSPPSPSLHFNLASLNNPLLYHTLQSISKSAHINALIIDFFNAAAFDVSSVLNIPTYVYYTTSAAVLSAILYMPTVHRSHTKSFKDYDQDIDVHFPGLPPVSISHMPGSFLDRTSNFYNHFLQLGRQLPRAKGFLVNTFASFQESTLRAISAGDCIPDGPTPPVFPVGPLISGKAGAMKKGEINGDQSGAGRAECLSWLDAQPSHSVIFLSFGSMGVFPRSQLIEMATALENSGQRFLWVVRAPLPEPKNGAISSFGSSSQENDRTDEEPSLESLLPEGFMGRVEGRGMVVKSWAPQVEVLSHGSVGGFVTHCGWNSVLEAVWYGVPMVAWPLYAEQKLNKLFLVEDAKVALPLKWEKDGTVRAEELERLVRELMAEDSASGKAVRERVTAMRAEAMAALGEGGSSTATLDQLVELWKRGDDQ
ncbi:hypothetical protein Dimus_000206 [Dionaea muscipula]